MQAIYNTLPFQKIPTRLVIEMAKTAVFWLNAFPVMGGASQDLSPRTILMEQQVDYKRHCHFQFREYAQTHEEHNNSMNPRTVGALTLHPVENGQRSFYFLSILTGRVLNQLHATALPMPDSIIDKIHRMAWQQKNNPGLIFANRNLNPDEYKDENDDDETYYDNDDGEEEDEEVLSYDKVEDNDNDGNEMAAHRPPMVNDEEEGDDDDNDNEMGGHDPPIAGAPPPVNLAQQPDNPPGEISGVEAADEAEEHGVAIDPEIPGVGEEAEPEIPGVGEEEDEVDDDESTQDEVAVKQPSAPPEVENNAGGRYNLHGGRNRNNDHHYAGEDFVVDNEVGIVMTTKGCSGVLETPQMSLKAGLQTFGDDGMKAVEKEMHQRHDHNMMTPVHKQCLTPEQRKEALAYLMFLKRKHCGKIKECRCADGRKQRVYITKEESTAQTVSREGVFLTTVIDAMED